MEFVGRGVVRSASRSVLKRFCEAIGSKNQVGLNSDIPTRNPSAVAWVQEMAGLCQPDHVYWCDGSEGEKKQLLKECLASGELEELNQEKLPNCYLHRSDRSDVARTED